MLLNQLVIGKSVEAALYAFLSGSYFLSTKSIPALFFRELSSPILGSQTEPRPWSRLVFMLGLLGRVLHYDRETSPRIVNNEIKFISNGHIQKYSFAECIIFDPTGLRLDNEIIKTRERSYLVIDDFELSCLGKKHPQIESYYSDTDFAKSIHFYTSPRVDGANYVTDCVMMSVMTQGQLNSFEYSDSIARFVVLRHLTSVGIRGIFMNYYKNGNPKFRKPKVRHVKRVVEERDNSTYGDTSFVRFCKMSIEDIVDEFATKG